VLKFVQEAVEKAAPNQEVKAGDIHIKRRLSDKHAHTSIESQHRQFMNYALFFYRRHAAAYGAGWREAGQKEGHGRLHIIHCLLHAALPTLPSIPFLLCFPFLPSLYSLVFICSMFS
jgi:hypothetical protein